MATRKTWKMDPGAKHCPQSVYQRRSHIGLDADAFMQHGSADDEAVSVTVFSRRIRHGTPSNAMIVWGRKISEPIDEADER